MMMARFPEGTGADVSRPWQALRGRVRGELRFDAPTARHVSWRAGGHAACVFIPADEADLGAALASLPDPCPVRCVGLGSNLLVRDGGFSGVLILTHRVLGGLTALGEGRFEAGAGVPCARLARTAARAGHASAAFLAGIPGTIGGALAQNAGAFGGETWDWVTDVTMIDRQGREQLFGPEAFAIGYREVRSPETGFYLRARFDFGRDITPFAERTIRDLLVRRAQHQPTGVPSCGSVFRNPPGHFAGRLIEAAGMKGRRIGGAVVSERHANFILNEGGATATEIEALMDEVREAVAGRFGITLVPEVCIVGEPPSADTGRQTP